MSRRGLPTQRKSLNLMIESVRLLDKDKWKEKQKCCSCKRIFLSFSLLYVPLKLTEFFLHNTCSKIVVECFELAKK